MKRLYTSLLLGLTLSAAVALAFANTSCKEPCGNLCEELKDQEGLKSVEFQWIGTVKTPGLTRKLIDLDPRTKQRRLDMKSFLPPKIYNTCICAFPWPAKTKEFPMAPPDCEV